jgi:hypothetical protein
LCQNRQSSRHSISSACDKHNLTFQVLWTFSIYLESVAILPQLFMVSKTGEAESITSHYLFALGSYRALYILNWIYRYATEVHYDLIAIVAGIVQTVLYCDFFYLYVTKGELFFFLSLDLVLNDDFFQFSRVKSYSCLLKKIVEVIFFLYKLFTTFFFANE